MRFLNTNLIVKIILIVYQINVSLSKFRLSSHDLEIERERYVNLDRNDRLCRSCNDNDIEHECHFLLVCQLYRDLRRKYLKAYYCQRLL